MSSLGFDNYVAPLKLYLNKYREAQKGGDKGSSAAGDGAGDSSLNVDSFAVGADSASSISFFISSSSGGQVTTS